MNSSLGEIVYPQSSPSDDVAFIFQTNSQYVSDPFESNDFKQDDQLKIESPIDCLEALNTTFSVDDFHWDASDDALIDSTIPIWLFPAPNIPTSASACSTAISTTTDSAIAAQMDTLFLPEKDYISSYSMHNNLACPTDIAKSYLQFSVDSDHTSLDEERCHLAKNLTHDIQGANPLYQSSMSMKHPWIHRSILPDSSVNTNNNHVDTTYNPNNSSRNIHNNHNYNNSFGMAAHLYRHQRNSVSSPIIQGHITDTIVSSSHTDQSLVQEHPYHTRKRKLHFSSSYTSNESQEMSYHLHPGIMQIYSDEEDYHNDNNDNDDSEDSQQNQTSLTFDATSKTMNKRRKKSMKKQYCDYGIQRMGNEVSKDSMAVSDRQQDVLRKLQSMVDSITDPVGKYMRKRNLTPMDAIKFNIHELLLQAPKKPRQRYGPRHKKKATGTSLNTSDDWEEDNINTHNETNNNANNNSSNNIGNNMRSGENQHHLPEEEEDNDDLEDVFRDEYEDTATMTQVSSMPRNETTRARNREHARATRRRRRIFKEIDSFLQHCNANNNSNNNVDPLFLRQSSH